jgi:hypothetical protein
MRRSRLLITALLALGLVAPSSAQIMLLGVGGAAAAGACPGCDFSTNLIAWWDFNEASGNLLDAHNVSCGGGGCDLTETSGVIDTSATAIQGTSRDFEATAVTAQFQRNDEADISTGDIDFTWAGWVRAETLAANPIIAHKGWLGTPDADSEWLLYYNTSTNRLNFSKRVAATVTVVGNNAGALSTATWYFIAAWHDATNDSMGIRAFGSASSTADTQASSTGLNDGTRLFQVGALSASGSYWDGLMDESAFWKRVLSSDELTYLYNSGAGRTYAEAIACTGC